MKIKRLISVLLVVLLLTSICVITTSAANTDVADIGYKDPAYPDYEYRITSDSTAEIVSYSGSASAIYIPSELGGYRITSIGNNAFHNNVNITYVSIPDSVISIGNDAFGSCYYIKSIIIGKSVEFIDNYAFSYCEDLNNITIPHSVSDIGDEAFEGCTSLTEVYIPESVTYIGTGVFGNCNLSNITVDVNNPKYDSRDNCNGIIETETNSLITGCKNTVIPNTVTWIDESAFYGCQNLTDIVIPDSVTGIDKWAFYGCLKLSSILIPKKTTQIYGNSFSSCDFSSISVEDDNPVYDNRNNCNAIIETESNTLIVGSNRTLIPNSVISIGNNAFDGRYQMTSIAIPNSVTSIGDCAFNTCSALTSINIPDSVTSMGIHAFRSCSSLTNVYISNSLTEIPDCAFEYCSKLTSITIPDSVTTIDDNAFASCSKLASIQIPDSVISIDRYSFSGTAWLENQPNGLVYAGKVVYLVKGDCPAEIAIKSGTLGIADWAFQDCTNLTSVSIPRTVKSIGELAFFGCTALSSVNIPDSVISIGKQAFFGCVCIEYVYIPNSVKIIGQAAFGFSQGPYSYIKKDEFIIYGYAGSEAQTYANHYDIQFIPLDPTDTEQPTVSLTSTNNVAVSQNVTLSLSDNAGIKGYYWGTNSNYLSNVYTETSNTSVSKAVDTNGTYYATAVDTSGNVSDTKSITFYKTTLNANGGSVNPASVLTKSGNSFTLPTPTRSGNYVYNGWSTSSSATSGIKSLTPSSNATYYALWKTNEVNDSFVWGQDNWKFDNTSSSFKNYDVNSTVFNKMKQDFGLSNSQAYELNQAIKEDNYYGFGGSCFGMTVSEIMAKHGDLKLSRYGGNDIVNKNTNTSNMTSVINFIQELQSVSGYSQNIRQAPFISGSHSQYDFIDKAESVLTNEKILVKISYGIMHLNKNTGKYSSAGYHAVLGYGIENCNYYSSFTGKTYDKRILVADPNHLSQNTLYGDSCIYYKSTDHSWICPYWNKSGSSYSDLCYWNASSGSSTNTGLIRNIMKYNSLSETVDLMTDYSVSHYISGVTIDNISGNTTTVEQIKNTGNPNLDYAGGANSGIAQYNIEMDDSYNVKDNEEFYALWNPTANYSVSYTKPSDFNLKMDYESIMYYADVKNGMYSLFKPNGSIQLRGSDATYSITMVTDDSECVTDWFALSVSGNDTDNLTFSKQSNGYILNSSNMKNIKVSASNNDVEATRTFSTNYNSVFIYEIDEETIGLKVDTDNNGTYETELAASEDTVKIGDANGDNNIDILDATLAQKYSVGKANLTEEQLAAADVNGDGIVDILDAAEIQKYAAGKITEFKKKA